MYGESWSWKLHGNLSWGEDGEFCGKRWEAKCPRQKELQKLEERPLQVSLAFPYVQGPGPMPRAGPLGCGAGVFQGRPWGLDDPGTQVPAVLGAQGGLLLLAVSDLVSPSAVGPGFLGLGWLPGCSQDGPLPCLALCPCGRQGWEKLCGHHQLYIHRARPLGCAGGLLPPCRGHTAGQWAEGSFCTSAGSSLSAGRCPGPPTVPGGPGCPALILSPLQPLLSAYPANGSLIGSLGKYFLEHLLHARHCPGPSHGPNRQTPAFVECTLWGSELPSDLEYPSCVCGCRSLPCRPCSSWQTILTLQKLAPSVPVVSGTV